MNIKRPGLHLHEPSGGGSTELCCSHTSTETPNLSSIQKISCILRHFISKYQRAALIFREKSLICNTGTSLNVWMHNSMDCLSNRSTNNTYCYCKTWAEEFSVSQKSVKRLSGSFREMDFLHGVNSHHCLFLTVDWEFVKVFEVYPTMCSHHCNFIGNYSQHFFSIININNLKKNHIIP